MMNEQDVLNKLTNIFNTIIGQKDDIQMTSLLREDLGINSIGLIYFVVAIEEAFNISMDNVSFDTFKSVHDVVEYIMERI